MLCKDGGAGITLLFCVVPVLLVAGQIQFDLAFLQLGLLQTEEIGIGFLEKVHPAFSHAGTQTIDVPRNKLHISSYSDPCAGDISKAL